MAWGPDRVRSTVKLDQAVCIVTGASSGIGAATARQLSGLGASVVLAARRTDRIEALARDLPGSLAVTTDVGTVALSRAARREASDGPRISY